MGRTGDIAKRMAVAHADEEEQIAGETGGERERERDRNRVCESSISANKKSASALMTRDALSTQLVRFLLSIQLLSNSLSTFLHCYLSL